LDREKALQKISHQILTQIWNSQNDKKWFAPGAGSDGAGELGSRASIDGLIVVELLPTLFFCSMPALEQTIMRAPRQLVTVWSFAVRPLAAPAAPGQVALLAGVVAALVVPSATAGIFNDIPGLSQAGRNAFVVQFDGRTGVTTNGFGGVTGWQGLDGNGSPLVTAVRNGNVGFNDSTQSPDDSLNNNNISYNASKGSLIFTEKHVYETAHLYVPLQDGDGNGLLTGGAATIFWRGSYSGSNPQGNGTLGRYAYNITAVAPNFIGGGFNHQRRDAGQNVGAFVTTNTGSSSQTRLGNTISGYNDTATTWTSIYDFASSTRTIDFYATDAEGNRTDLAVVNPTSTAGTSSFGGTAVPNLYIGAVSYPFFYPTQPSVGTNGGWSFIGEMEQLIIFQGVLSSSDVAAVEAYLVAVPEPSSICLLLGAAAGGAAFVRRRNRLPRS